MTHATTIPATTPLLDKPICYPVRLVLKPFTLLFNLITKIIQVTLGYFVRLGVFPSGESNRSWLKRKIIECYKGGCYDTHERSGFNPDRLEHAFSVLASAGAVRYPTYSKNGTKLDTMILRYRDMKKKIEENGGAIISTLPITIEKQTTVGKEYITICRENRTFSQNEYVDVILPDASKPNRGWENFSQKTLAHLGLEKIVVTLANGKTVEGFITKHWNEKNPHRPKENQCYIRCNAPTESMAMGKRDEVRTALGLRGDVLCFDYPGTWKSEGVPSEGSYYLAAETIVEHAVNEYRYDWKDVWVAGFCLGGAIAAHLKSKYHEKGINLFLQNTFDSMLKVYSQLSPFPANKLAVYGLPELQSRDPAVTDLVHQDGFDSVQKLINLRDKPASGMSLIVNTSTDHTVHPDAHYLLYCAAEKVSEKACSIVFDPDNKSKNGHSLDVCNASGTPGQRSTWDKSVTFIASKDQRTWWETQKSSFMSYCGY